MSAQLAGVLASLRSLREAEAVVAGRAAPELVFTIDGAAIQEDHLRKCVGAVLARPGPVSQASHAGTQWPRL